MCCFDALKALLRKSEDEKIKNKVETKDSAQIEVNKMNDAYNTLSIL